MVDVELVAKIVSPFLTGLILAIVSRHLEAKPKLISWVVHVTALPLPNNAQNPFVNMHSIVVRNAGKRSANNVRIGHAFLPPSYSIFPQVHYQILQSPAGATELLIPVLAPNEQVTLSYLYFPPLMWNGVNTYTKSDEALAKVLEMYPTTRPNKYIVAGLWVLIFIGASTCVYWLILLLLAYVMGGF